MNGPDPDVRFLDEVLFHLHGSSCRMWVPPEDRQPHVLLHPTRRSIGFFGAVRPRDGLFAFMPCAAMFNAETFLGFLYRPSDHWTGRDTAFIPDNARYHHADMPELWKCGHPGIAPDHLPPFGPELNPIERAWKSARKEATHDRCFNDPDELRTAAVHQLARWTDPNDVLRRLCAVI